MELITIKHYIEDFKQKVPAFVLTLSDGKNYFSHKFMFLELTDENINYLIQKRGYSLEELDMLMTSNQISTNEIKNGSYMFYGCGDISIVGDFLMLEIGICMFHDIFRVHDYPRDVLTSLEECLDFIKNRNIDNVDYKRLNEFWNKYPNGAINFG